MSFRFSLLAFVTLGAIVFAPLPALAQEGGTQQFGVSKPLPPEPETPKKDDAPPEKEQVVLPQDLPDSLVDYVSRMTLLQRVSQLMIVSMEGMTTPTAPDRELVKRFTPGGVLISAVRSPEVAADYITIVRNLEKQVGLGIPLFIGTNLHSLPRTFETSRYTYFAPIPSLMTIAAASDPEITHRLGGFLADHLKVMGFNMNVGPSLELAPDLPDAKASLQTLGSDPEAVARNGVTIIDTIAENGLIGVAVGFPGGGANRVDPNHPAVLSTPVDLLPNRELLPYRRAIEAGVPIVHVSNTLAPTIDKENRPASLSPRVMKDVLRGGLAFDGVIIAGPVDTNEIVVRYNLTEATLLALDAGADMILWNGTGVRVAKTVDEVVRAIQNGRLDQEVIDAAVTRVLTLKQEMGLQTWPYPVPKDAAKLSKEKDYLDQAYEMERRALTIVQNLGNVLPLNDKQSVPVAVTGIIGVEELHEALEEYIEPISQQRITTARHLGKIHDFEIDRLTKRIFGLRTVIITLTPEVDADSQRALVNAFRAKGVRVVVVYLGYPENISAIRGANTILLSFSNPAAYKETMKAVADILVGQAPLGIVPEFTELTTKVGQEDVYNALDVIRAPSGRLPVDLEPPFLAGLSVNYDPTFTIKKVEWNFGDGKKSKEIIVRKAYKKPGRYPASLTVTDKKKRVSRRDFFVTVE